MNGLVNRVRLEAKGRTEKEVNDALTNGALFVAQSFGGTWHTDDDHPPEIQTTRDGSWGFIWLKRVMT